MTDWDSPSGWGWLSCSHTSNIIGTEQIIFRNIYLHIHTNVHILTINEKEAMTLKEGCQVQRKLCSPKFCCLVPSSKGPISLSQGQMTICGAHENTKAHAGLQASSASGVPSSSSPYPKLLQFMLFLPQAPL